MNEDWEASPEAAYKRASEHPGKAALWDQLMRDIKAGKWQIVPVKSDGPMQHRGSNMIYEGTMGAKRMPGLDLASVVWNGMSGTAPKYPGLPE